MGLLPLWWWLAERFNETGEMEWQLAALATYLGAAISDAIDGYVARRFDQKSTFGAALDAAVDKIFSVFTLGYLAIQGWGGFSPLPMWFFALTVFRDLLILGGLFTLYRVHRSVPMVPLTSGKVTTILLFVLASVAQAAFSPGLTSVLLWLSTVALVVSGVLYTRWGIQQLNHPGKA